MGERSPAMLENRQRFQGCVCFHDAVADDGISAHITIGILSFTWLRYFTELFTQLENEKAFREAVPFWRDDLEDCIQEKTALLKDTIDRLNVQEGLKKMTRQYEKTQPQLVSRYFESLLQLDDLSNDSVIRLNGTVFFERGEQDGNCFIKCFDKTILFPQTLKPLIDFIFDAKSVTLRDLPGSVDEDVKKTAVVKLIREGVVYIGAGSSPN